MSKQSRKHRRIDTEKGIPMTVGEIQAAEMLALALAAVLDEWKKLYPGWQVWITEASIITPDGGEILFDLSPDTGETKQ